MGLIDNLRNKINNRGQNQQKFKLQNNVIERQDGTLISIFPKEIKYSINHSNGEKTKLITGNVIISKMQDTQFVSGEIPVCFEIPSEMNVQEVLNMGFLQELENRGYFRDVSFDRYNTLGRVNIKDGYWNIEQMSNRVLQSVENLNIELQENKEQERQKNARQHIQHHVDNQLHIEQQGQQKAKRAGEINEQRKNNITFTSEQVKIVGKEFLESYRTVDKYTGEEIVLTNVRNIGYDEQQNHLYTASIIKQCTEANYLGRNEMNAVIFSTAYPLNQIEEMRDQHIIEQISELLSVNNLSVDGMTYLGQLDINRNITRRLEQTTEITQSNVRYQQEQYRIRNQYHESER